MIVDTVRQRPVTALNDYESAKLYLDEFDLDVVRLRYTLRGERHGEELRPIRYTSPVVADATLDEFREALAKTIVEASATAEVHICPYNHRQHRRRLAGGAAQRRHIHADLDGPLAFDVLPELGAFAVGSGTVWADGPNAHVYLRLDRSVSAEEHHALCDGLRRYLGDDADPSKTRDNDVLRIPGTLNHKHEPPCPVVWLRRPDHDEVRTWTPEELAKRLDVDLRPRPDSPRPRSDAAADGTRSDRVPEAAKIRRAQARIDGLVRALADAPRGHVALLGTARLAGAICASTPGLDEREILERIKDTYVHDRDLNGKTIHERRREADHTATDGWNYGHDRPELAND